MYQRITHVSAGHCTTNKQTSRQQDKGCEDVKEALREEESRKEACLTRCCQREGTAPCGHTRTDDLYCLPPSSAHTHTSSAPASARHKCRRMICRFRWKCRIARSVSTASWALRVWATCGVTVLPWAIHAVERRDRGPVHEKPVWSILAAPLAVLGPSTAYQQAGVGVHQDVERGAAPSSARLLVHCHSVGWRNGTSQG